MGNNNLSKHANLQQILSPDWDLKNIKVNAYIFKKKEMYAHKLKISRKFIIKKTCTYPNG